MAILEGMFFDDSLVNDCQTMSYNDVRGQRVA
jgi:hypothetical protein